jgi:hypothetical protein
MFSLCHRAFEPLCYAFLFSFRIPIAILSRVCHRHNPLAAAANRSRISAALGSVSQAFCRHKRLLEQPFSALPPSISAVNTV